MDAAKYGHLDCLKYLHETAKAPWDYGPYEERTRTTTPNVYNTSSTITVLSQKAGLTKMESYAHQSHRHRHLHHHKHIHILRAKQSSNRRDKQLNCVI